MMDMTNRAVVAVLDKEQAAQLQRIEDKLDQLNGNDFLALLKLALPYIKTVSRNDMGGYSDLTPTLYEDMMRALEGM